MRQNQRRDPEAVHGRPDYEELSGSALFHLSFRIFSLSGKRGRLPKVFYERERSKNEKKCQTAH
jgi:hypothetical protein